MNMRHILFLLMILIAGCEKNQPRSIIHTPPTLGVEIESEDENFPKEIVVDKKFLMDGKVLYESTCIVCHGMSGHGDGIVTQKGVAPPPSYHEERLRESGPGYFYQIMSYGGDRMPPYDTRLTSLERWKVAAYIKVLQLSRRFPLKNLNQSDRKKFL